MGQGMGKYIILIGAIIIIVGIIVHFFGDKLYWIGRLPGDIRIERENVRFYFPITTIILFSLLLTIIVRLFRHFF